VSGSKKTINPDSLDPIQQEVIEELKRGLSPHEAFLKVYTVHESELSESRKNFLRIVRMMQKAKEEVDNAR
jgi:hypothetical protein